MLINAGYENETPLKAHDFFAKLGGYGYITEKEGAHPGYEDRRKELRIFLEKYQKDNDPVLKTESTKGNCIFNRKENILTYQIS